MSESSFFSNLTAKDFPFDKEVITIDSAMPVDKAFKVLVDNHVSAAPVFDKTKNEYVGFFDVSDMLAYIVEMIQQRDAAQHCEWQHNITIYAMHLELSALIFVAF